MEASQNALKECDFSDLGISGPKYTWSNCREGADFTKERLNRVVANCERCELFHDAEVSIGAAVWSDHLTLKTFKGGNKGWRNFRFEARWELDIKCREIIK
jgi:hypothetical protein